MSEQQSNINDNNELQEKVHIADISCYGHWEIKKSKYVESTIFYIGIVKIAEYFYDATVSVGDNNKYKVISHIPTINVVKKHYEYESDCRNVCIEIAKFFCGQLTRNVIK